MQLYPMRFEPFAFKKIWGGRKLETLLGRSLPEGAVGESWEVSDRPGFESVVANGPLKGQTLRALMAERGPHLVGERVFRQGPDRFPLLIKLIDAGDELSVQVHPDDDYAALHLGPEECGKTEMWVVLQAEPGAMLTAGLLPGTSRDEFKAALASGTVGEVLNRFSVKAGDAVYVPAGRVHAIGKGILVAEVQQNSDTTYRVFDHNRIENGKPRALHVQQALETIRFDKAMQDLPDLQPQALLRGDDHNRVVLASCPYFHVERIWVNPLYRCAGDRESFHVIMGLQGEGQLHSRQGEPLSIKAGDTVLIPAGCDYSLRRTGEDCQVLMAKVP